MMTEDDGTAPVMEGAAQLGLLAAELPIRLTVAHGKPCGAVKCNGNVMVSSAAGVTVSQYESGGMVRAADWEATLVLQCRLDAGGDALQFCIGPCFINMYPSMVIVIGNTVT